MWWSWDMLWPKLEEVSHTSGKMILIAMSCCPWKDFYGFKQLSPPQDGKRNDFFVEVHAGIWIRPLVPVLFPRGAQRGEQLQMAGFRKPRAQKGRRSAVHLVYKLQREAAVSTPLWKQLKWCQQDVHQTEGNRRGEERRAAHVKDKGKASPCCPYWRVRAREVGALIWVDDKLK